MTNPVAIAIIVHGINHFLVSALQNFLAYIKYWTRITQSKRNQIRFIIAWALTTIGLPSGLAHFVKPTTA
jgi:uncharacterized membrane protein